jgi:hypothetical protein
MNTGSRLLSHLLLLLGLSVTLAVPLSAAEPDAEADATAGPQLADPQLDQLLGPIALYPDALVALILPAATAPTEIVLAARYLNANGDPAQIDAQPWSDSVKALARYAEVVKWMDENIAWTKQIGDAFLTQPADLMNSVQRLRARARATGALVSTPQQQVVVDGDTIEIVPGQPDIIYVPRYDPEIVYVVQQPGYYYPYGPYLTFGGGFPVGLWMNYDFDWRRRTIWVGDRHHDWREHRDWRRQQPPGRPNYSSNPNWHAWRPPVNRPPQPPRDIHRPRPGLTQPRPFPGTPGFSNSPGRDDAPNRYDRPYRPRPDVTVRPPRPDDNNRNNRPPRPDANNGNMRPPRTDAPRTDRRANPSPNVSPRTPPPERRTFQPPAVPSNQPSAPAVYQPRHSAPANNVQLAPPAASRPPPGMDRPSATPRSPNPPSPPPPTPVARDPDANQKQN